jgi:hypothetical protein
MLHKIADLSKTGVMRVEISTGDSYERLFLKKGSGHGAIELSDMSILSNGCKLMTNDSMIVPESDGLERGNGTMMFKEEAARWAFFAVAFYQI